MSDSADDRNANQVNRSDEDLPRKADPGIVHEFIDFLKHNKKWWLTPIVIGTLLLIGAALLLPSPVAPFIYTLF